MTDSEWLGAAGAGKDKKAARSPSVARVEGALLFAHQPSSLLKERVALAVQLWRVGVRAGESTALAAVRKRCERAYV